MDNDDPEEFEGLVEIDFAGFSHGEQIRTEALALAVRSVGQTMHEDRILDRANGFEAYIRGEN